jgi:hypothetical protein
MGGQKNGGKATTAHVLRLKNIEVPMVTSDER